MIHAVVKAQDPETRDRLAMAQELGVLEDEVRHIRWSVNHLLHLEQWKLAKIAELKAKMPPAEVTKL